MMYALLALGFSMVYGIIELINFAHFSVFMIGSFVAMFFLEWLGITSSSAPLFGWPLAGVLVLTLGITMLVTGVLGMLIERVSLKPMRGISGTAPMITTIGVSFILTNVAMLARGPVNLAYPNLLPQVTWTLGGVDYHLKELLLWSIALTLMIGLHWMVQRTKLGKAMRATAADGEAAMMMGVEVDQIIAVTFFVGSALAGAAGMIHGLYYGQTSFVIGYSAGLRAFTAAVLGGIGNIVGAMLGGLIIGLIEALGGHFIAVQWADVIIFSVLILLLVFKPTGLLGRAVARA